MFWHVAKTVAMWIFEMDVSNKVCIITGSAQGLGKAFAIRLLSAGAKVCLSDLKVEAGEKTLTEFVD